MSVAYFNPLMEYLDGSPSRPFDRVELLDPKDSPMRHLSDFQIASARIALTPPTTWRTGIVFNTTARLHLWQERGELASMSLWKIARQIERVYYPNSWRLKRPLRGLEVLRHVCLMGDETGVSISIAAVDPVDPRWYRRVDLLTQLADEIAA